MDDRFSLPLTTGYKVTTFSGRVMRGFQRSNGTVLAGAMAYSALLSVVPLAMLLTAVLSHFIDGADVSRAVRAELRNVLLPGQVTPLIDAVDRLVEASEISGLLGGIGVMFFATGGFRVLQAALDQVFQHRRDRLAPRPLWATMLLSLVFIAAIGVALLLRIRMGSGDLFGMGELTSRLGGFLTLGVLMSAVYKIMPLGGLPMRASLIGGFAAAGMWELLQAGLSWYFDNFSAVNLIYGSMGTVVLILITLQAAGVIVLLGAQVIAEVERSRQAGLRWYEEPPAGLRLNLRDD